MAFGLLAFGLLAFGLLAFCLLAFGLLVFRFFSLLAFGLLVVWSLGLLAFDILDFWHFGLMAFGLYVGLRGCGLCLLFCWFADFVAWMFVQTRSRIDVKMASKSLTNNIKNQSNIIQNSSKFDKKRIADR